MTMKTFKSKQHVSKHLEAAYHPGQTCRWCICWVCSWEVYSRFDCQSVTLEHTQRHRVLCRSPPDDCPAANSDPETIYLWHFFQKPESLESLLRLLHATPQQLVCCSIFSVRQCGSTWPTWSHQPHNVHLDFITCPASMILKRHYF